MVPLVAGRAVLELANTAGPTRWQTAACDPSPIFRDHPYVIATGSAVENQEPCHLCGRTTRLRYNGPIFGQQVDNLCLACIASGEAVHQLVGPDGPAEFHDVGWGHPRRSSANGP
jgi:uncharacterized protein CbrC (UPF0167 family)